jgi:hypothetical protein
VNCFVCGTTELSTPEAWRGFVAGAAGPVAVATCSEACRSEMGWVVFGGGPGFGSARTAPLPEGAKRQKTR